MGTAPPHWNTPLAADQSPDTATLAYFMIEPLTGVGTDGERALPSVTPFPVIRERSIGGAEQIRDQLTHRGWRAHRHPRANPSATTSARLLDGDGRPHAPSKGLAADEADLFP